MEALFVEEGALTWVIVDVSLVERVDATHVSLEGESRAHVAHTLVLREHIALNDGAHGHVGAIVHRELLKLAAFILLECASTHFLCRVADQVLIEGRGLLSTGEAACLRGVSREAFVLDVDHLISVSLPFCFLVNLTLPDSG